MLNLYSDHISSLPDFDMLPTLVQPLPSNSPKIAAQHVHHHTTARSSAAAVTDLNANGAATNGIMTNSHYDPAPSHSLDGILQEITEKFVAPLTNDNLLSMSRSLREQFEQKLRHSPQCMLPTYNHTLPSGRERGTYLALDVGGSGLRVALVVLEGPGMRIVRLFNYRIDNAVKQLKGAVFFDWIAERIGDTLADEGVQREVEGVGTLNLGVAWSFPVEQTSVRSGRLLEMGKGFCATNGVLGEDLGELVMRACRGKNLDVRMGAIINDSAATLLSRAYADPTTRLALILGTGTNAAIILPVSALDKSKFGSRPQSWHDAARHVLVNTELSMFGKDILPTSRWDDHINRTHMHPDYQPFELLISGRYLGEIVRLILVDAIREAELFRGRFPERFLEPYALETSTVAAFEVDDSPTLTLALDTLLSQHPLPASSPPPSVSDLMFIRSVAQTVSQRAAAYLATGVHALWSLRNSAITEAGAGSSPGGSADGGQSMSIGCNGSVIERYPSFRERCQGILDGLLGEGKVQLEVAVESALYGAAVAVACLEGSE